jgi:hypothetical protein
MLLVVAERRSAPRLPRKVWSAAENPSSTMLQTVAAQKPLTVQVEHDYIQWASLEDRRLRSRESREVDRPGARLAQG